MERVVHLLLSPIHPRFLRPPPTRNLLCNRVRRSPARRSFRRGRRRPQHLLLRRRQASTRRPAPVHWEQRDSFTYRFRPRRPEASAAASDKAPLVGPRAEEPRPPQRQAREEETPIPLTPSSASEHSEARACSLGEERLVHILFSSAQADATTSAAAPLARPSKEEARACKKLHCVIAACTL